MSPVDPSVASSIAPTSTNHSPATAEPIHVACCVDDRYIMGLAVTLQSAATHLSLGRRLVVDLVDGGVSEANRARLDEAMSNVGVELHWRALESSRLQSLPISHHISTTAYFRVLLGELLAERDRVLYLDCDLLIRGDLSELWETSLDGVSCAAAADVGCPYFDSLKTLKNVRRAGPYLSVFRPIRNYRQLGFDGHEPYFNSGVLLIDLEAWRRERIAERTIECLERNRRHVWCWDQYGLNIVLSGQWRRLPVRWNVGAHLYEYPNEAALPLPIEECKEAIRDPSLVHFTTNRKPWSPGAEHPYLDQFFETLDETPWRGWRPGSPPATLHQWLVDRVTLWRRGATISGRHALLASLPPRTNTLTQLRAQ